jgi:hypothetical protein
MNQQLGVKTAGCEIVKFVAGVGRFPKRDDGPWLIGIELHERQRPVDAWRRKLLPLQASAL